MGAVADAYADRARAVSSFFETQAPRVARATFEMAKRFHAGGRILAFGAGSAATDAQHIAVEFVHPVIVGKRALPAVALPNDAATFTGLALRHGDVAFTAGVDVLGRSRDIAVGLVHSSADPGRDAVAAALGKARSNGMLTVALTGRGTPFADEPDWNFICDDGDPFVVQEVHETLYHVFWELVHVFFEHRGLLRDERRESTLGGSAFLYPMLDDAERELDPVLASVEASVRRKAEDVCAVRDPGCEDDLHRAAELLAEGFAAGRKLLAFGNGGSATDAADLVCDLLDPPPELRPLPAISLTNDDAVITAVANDVGFENVFRRQIIAYGDRGDVAVGISTSGNSRSLVAAFEEARSRGLATVAFVGYGGGEVVARGLADVAVVVHHDYIPRIQEAQATQYHLVRRLAAELL